MEIKLNRVELLEQRKERLEKLNNAILTTFRTKNITLKNEALRLLKLESGPEKEYSIAVKCTLMVNEIT